MPNTPPPPALESLDRFVQWAAETAQVKGPKIVDWLYTEFPDVIHEFLAWHFAQSFITFIICVFLIFGLPFFNYKIARKAYSSLKVAEWRDEGPYWGVTILTAVFLNSAAQISCWLNINLVWLKIILAPKVYLLETFANVLK